MAMEQSSSTVVVVPAEPSDFSQITDLYLASRADALPYLNRVHSDEAVRAWIKDTLLRRGVTWLAKEQDTVVGFLSLLDNDIDQLYILPGYYRRGIGSKLLRRAMEESPERLHLYTFQKNTRARAFYEKHGFRAIRFADGSQNEEKEPDILYEWRGVE